ncbi:MAG: ABC transporter substrate-binding protein [Candidatus Rokubacteria bacterium]|nr:ABC transporter substrate-binding protein [Candidatus Rokubacteria bacterium]
MSGHRLIPLLAVFVLGLASDAWAGQPTDQLRAYTDQVLKVLQNPALSLPERREAVKHLAEDVFEVSETAKRALGPHWLQRTPAEREEFVKLFANLLEQTYIARIDEFGGEKLRYVSEQIDGDRAIVRARIMTKNGTEVPVESRLLRKETRWLIYDILVENLSLISNYRSQFDRVIRTTSYEELVKRLKTRGEFLSDKAIKTPRRDGQGNR